jgi:Protein of unknown function (DUF3237)
MPETKRRELFQLAAGATLAACAPKIASTLRPPIPTRTTMQSRALMTLRLSTAPTQDIGAGPHGTRVTFPVIGGSFEGEKLRGKVLGGDDWTVRRPDGVIELDLRVTLETDDGALIHMTFEGLRNDAAPGGAYFRTLPRFETAHPRYAFLNRLLAVGTAEIAPEGPAHAIEELM